MSGLEIVAFAMGAVGFVETVLAAWDHMEQRRQDHRRIQIFAEDLKLFGLKNRRDDLKISLELAQKVMRDRSVPKGNKLRLARDFKNLSDILDSLPAAAEAVATGSSSSNLIFRRKTTADRDLKSKLATFNEALSTFHQAVMNLRAITLTESSLLLKPQDLTLIGSSPEMARISETVYSAKASYVKPGEGTTTVRDILLEPRPYTENNKAELEDDMRSMATTLNSALPAWNIPLLIGYRTNLEKKTMELVFDRPYPARELVSLANVYVSGTPEPSLNVRIALCSQLAVAVIQAHTLGMIHKHIRPDNLLIALSRNEEGGMSEASFYLARWQNSRIINGVVTARLGESSVQKAMHMQHEPFSCRVFHHPSAVAMIRQLLLEGCYFIEAIRASTPASSPGRGHTPVTSPSKLHQTYTVGDNEEALTEDDQPVTSTPKSPRWREPPVSPTKGAPGRNSFSSPMSARSVRTNVVGSDTLSKLPASQVRDMREAFQVLDRDNDGNVNRDDVADVLSNLGRDPSSSATAQYFPVGAAQTMNLPTFLSTLSNLLAPLSSQKELLNAFAAFDDDDSGQVDVAELPDALLHTNPDIGESPLTEREVDEVLNRFTGRRAFGGRGKQAAFGSRKRGDVFHYQDFVGSIMGSSDNGNGSNSAAKPPPAS